ncbi:MAG TPA: type II secretion system protein [Symbiobacteriaceae bacterium]|nr:type II secretion system protein [Symbiobacteriaceae bacterium]
MMQKLRKRDGFTLIELVVVVAILGILAVIVTPKVLGAIENAKNSSIKSSSKQIQVAMERINAETGSYPDGDAFCDSGTVTWTDNGDSCDPATMATVLKDYVSLDTSIIDSATYDEDYVLTISFVNGDETKDYEITPEAVADVTP